MHRSPPQHVPTPWDAPRPFSTRRPAALGASPDTAPPCRPCHPATPTLAADCTAGGTSRLSRHGHGPPLATIPGHALTRTVPHAPTTSRSRAPSPPAPRHAASPHPAHPSPLWTRPALSDAPHASLNRATALPGHGPPCRPTRCAAMTASGMPRTFGMPPVPLGRTTDSAPRLPGPQCAPRDPNARPSPTAKPHAPGPPNNIPTRSHLPQPQPWPHARAPTTPDAPRPFSTCSHRPSARPATPARVPALCT